jgi:hypothetical protein
VLVDGGPERPEDHLRSQREMSRSSAISWWVTSPYSRATASVSVVTRPMTP